jgi:hypothetical protein
MNQKVLTIAAVLLLLSVPLAAQQRGQRGAAPPPTAKATAPIDLTGYWTAVISEDWHTRMLTAPKNDMGSGTFPIQAGGRGVGQSNIPWNAEGRRVVGAWDPSKDEAEGNQCKSYGAAGIMRQRVLVHPQENRPGKVTRPPNGRFSAAAATGQRAEI